MKKAIAMFTTTTSAILNENEGPLVWMV